jgi:hypothetical protein
VPGLVVGWTEASGSFSGVSSMPPISEGIDAIFLLFAPDFGSTCSQGSLFTHMHARIGSIASFMLVQTSVM